MSCPRLMEMREDLRRRNSPSPATPGEGLLPRRARTQLGFTLIELLIAMTVVSVVALTLAAALHIAFSARDASERAVDAGRSSDLVMDYLGDDLQCAMPPLGLFAGTFEGTNAQDSRGNEADDLVFYSTASSPAHPTGANGEIKQIELTMYQPPGSTDHVLVRRTLNNLLNPNQEIPDEEILCRHVHDFTLQYFDGNEWQEVWDSTQNDNMLPLAVQVSLTLESPEKNRDGTPVLQRYTRIFQCPCYGETTDSPPTSVGTGNSTSTSGTGTTSSGSSAGGTK